MLFLVRLLILVAALGSWKSHANISGMIRIGDSFKITLEAEISKKLTIPKWANSPHLPWNQTAAQVGRALHRQIKDILIR